MFGGRFSLLKSSSNWPPERAVSILSPPNSCQPIKVATLPLKRALSTNHAITVLESCS